MRRYFLALVFLMTLGGLTAGKVPEESAALFKTIQNRQGVGYEEPSLLARPVFQVEYLHRVEVLESKPLWQRVLPDGEYSPGWIHKSALVFPEISPEPVDKKTRNRIKKQEEALLGRAFRPQVADETRERESRDETGYAWLERYSEEEVFRPSLEEIVRFLEEGGLARVGGGGR